MQSTQAIDALAALAQEHRLALFRLLVQAGKDLYDVLLQMVG